MKNKHAQALGRIGGKVKSVAKTLAARKNAATRKKKARIASVAVLVLLSASLAVAGPVYQWGLPTDVPISADFDGDGKADIAVFRPSEVVHFGATWEGEQLYRTVSGVWLIRLSSLGYAINVPEPHYPTRFEWGLLGDVPITSDFDGDGRADVTVYRPSNGWWFTRYSSRGFDQMNYSSVQWGLPGDVPMPADYDGDHITDIAVYRPSSGTWHIRFSSGQPL